MFDEEKWNNNEWIDADRHSAKTLWINICRMLQEV